MHEEAWQDIYGKPAPRNTQLIKDLQYEKLVKGGRGLISETNDREHARLRLELYMTYKGKTDRADVCLRQAFPRRLFVIKNQS